MKNSNQNPVNAGSMADIAFLLLIFFLVSTTIQNDVGINQKLPRECKGTDCSTIINENNVLNITLNKNNELMVKGEKIGFKSLKNKVVEFIDNNNDKSCDYCNGNSSSTLSDNPKKAVISLKTDRETSYKTFIIIQNTLMESYNDLRQVYALKTYGKSIEDLTDDELRMVKKAYPQIISEAEIN